jgi:hypothetical protein
MACSRMPKNKLRPPRFFALKSPPSFIVERRTMQVGTADDGTASNRLQPRYPPYASQCWRQNRTGMTLSRSGVFPKLLPRVPLPDSICFPASVSIPHRQPSIFLMCRKVRPCLARLKFLIRRPMALRDTRPSHQPRRALLVPEISGAFPMRFLRR